MSLARCDGCDTVAAVARLVVCAGCGSLLCARCFGPFSGGDCEVCAAGAVDEAPCELRAFIEDVFVRSGVL